jgi:hypothetical protein
MKLRIRHNSVRYRLGRSEVDRLRQGLECRETVEFPQDTLEYVIGPSDGQKIDISLEGLLIRATVPREQLVDWCDSDRVGLTTDVALPGAGSLVVLIEKDFRCLDPQFPEDQSDTFDNPLDTHVHCEPDV